MREAVGIPAGILAYAMSTIILLFLVQFVFAVPEEWPRLITLIVSIISFRLTCAAVRNFSTETGVKIVAVMIALFWLVIVGIDVFAGLDKVMEFLSGGQNSPNAFGFLKELANALWNIKICAGVTGLLALWTLSR